MKMDRTIHGTDERYNIVMFLPIVDFEGLKQHDIDPS